VSTSASTSTERQLERTLSRLRRGPATTLELRREEDILHPAGRIKTLRERGHTILMRRVEQQTDCGDMHRVGLYALIKSPHKR
jgi:hypothetical protein